MLIKNDTYQRETLSERPIRQPLKYNWKLIDQILVGLPYKSYDKDM